MKRLLCDLSDVQYNIALVEDGKLIEYITEHHSAVSLVGNIFCGRVETVLKGMEAAFVSIGTEKNAYLPCRSGETLKTGDTVLVQIIKDGSGKKGPVATQKLSFPGKYLVCIPQDDHVGISGKITNTLERERLQQLVLSLLPEGYGAIVRTDAIGLTPDLCERELQKLVQQAKTILQQGQFSIAPSLLYQGVSPFEKTISELYSSAIDEIVVHGSSLTPTQSNDKQTSWIPYQSDVPIFSYYEIQSQIQGILQPKVWLKSGGFIIIEQTEACVVIDVNTGKYTGNQKFSETSFRTNLEAAKEIAKQIRLRNISGIVIIDFIDMLEENKKKELLQTLKTHTQQDRLKTVVVGMTELGLVQLTRKKTRPSLQNVLTVPCKTCHGSGRVPSLLHVVEQLDCEVVSIFTQTIYDHILITAQPPLLQLFAGDNLQHIKALEEKYSKAITLYANPNLAYGEYQLQKEKRNSSI